MTGGAFVELSWLELRIASTVGSSRVLKSWARTMNRDRFGDRDDNGWQIDTTGALGELVVAKHWGIYWDPVPRRVRGQGDVGPLEVRCTERETGRLIVRPTDPDDGLFVLVVGAGSVRATNGRTVGRRYRIVGWISGPDARRRELEQPDGGRRPPAWFVPQTDLRPLDELVPVRAG